jgi:enoyl-CoA hydratase/carnithine racemase
MTATADHQSPVSAAVSTDSSGAKGDDAPVLSASPLPGVRVLTLNRPRSRNALSRELMTALHRAVIDAGGDASVRAIVIAAAGPAFSAGHDLKELTAHRQDADQGQQFFEDTMQACSALMQAIVVCPKPVIAAVHATATAAGCQLVATCDLAIASETAEFCTPGVNIGLFCSTPMVALSRNVGRKRAMEMLLLGDMLSAHDAAAYGLVNRVVTADRVLDGATAMAGKIAGKPAATVAIGKRAFYDQVELPLHEAYDHTVGVMVRNMLGADAIEGISAFIGKRPPNWAT